jgi:putative transposase
MVFHVLNRGVGRRLLFEKEGDFLAFEGVMEETLRTRAMRVCAYCLMPNHWHLVLWPEKDGDLAAFMQQLTNMHVKRWQQVRGSVGQGHLYQGRYKSFPVQSDEYFYRVVRYVERNALRAKLVRRAEAWRWSSLGRWGAKGGGGRLLSDWPLPRPTDWVDLVNEVQSEGELESLRRSVSRGSPFGDGDWSIRTADQLGLERTLHKRGRPRKPRKGRGE